MLNNSESKSSANKHFAILLAGGKSQRMDGIVHDKILARINGKLAVQFSLEAFAQSGIIDGLVIIFRDIPQKKELHRLVVRAFPDDFTIFYAQGGKERSDSVRAGLDLLPDDVGFVYIHDCARPAIKPQILKSLRETVSVHQCAVALAKKATDTIKLFESDPTQTPADAHTLQRDKLWLMETPQAFPRDLIEAAHSKKNHATDDLALVESMGKPVLLLPNPFPNPKLTTPSDFILLESILTADPEHSMTASFRIGHGYDIHQLALHRKCVIGGVTIPSDVGLVGHSDADVLSHAIADAILGALGLPDIGHYFPNTDDTIKGIDSQRIIKKAVELAKERNYRIGNIDTTIIAEKPKILSHIKAMKEVLAKTLEVDPTAIGIKATTNEKIGSLGSGKGIAAHATVLLQASQQR